MTSFWCLYGELGADLIYCSDVFIIEFEQVNDGWVVSTATNHEEHSQIVILLLTKSLYQIIFF